MKDQGLYVKLYVRGHELREGDLVVGDEDEVYVADVEHEDPLDETSRLLLHVRNPHGGDWCDISDELTYIVFREVK